MAIAYTWVFLGLLVAYLVYSRWAHLEPRYLVVAAAVLFAVTAIAYVSMDTNLANTLVVYAIFLFGGSLVLILFELRGDPYAARLFADPGREEPVPPPVEPSGEGHAAPQDPLHGLEQ